MSARKKILKDRDTSMELEHKSISLKALYIVYDADGTVPGEVLYLLRKWFGRRHCSACDITHGSKKVKPEWTILQTTGWLGVPLFNIHRDEMDAKLRTVVNTNLPCVAAQTYDSQYLLLLGPNDLEGCEGELPKLQERIVEALESCGFKVSAYEVGDGKRAYREAYPSDADKSPFELDAVVPLKSFDPPS